MNKKHINNPLDTERNTLHLSDDEKRFAIIDSLTVSGGQTITPIVTIRYQYDNHLGSACLELDNTGQIISYEEYHPFGTTSYRSGSTETEVSLKRYKYCGKERDEEIGLYYYGMRYYAAWICRFVSVDPLQFKYPHYTPYQYAGNMPISFTDLDGAEPDQGTGNISATVYFQFEEGLNLTFIDKLRYINQYSNNVINIWNTFNYNGNQVNVNNVNFVFAAGRTQNELGSYEFLVTVGDGTTANKDSIKGRSYVQGNIGYMYYDNSGSDAAHEFGHFLGLTDRYINAMFYSSITGSKNDNNLLMDDFQIPLLLPNAENDYNPFNNMYSNNGAQLTQKQLSIVFNQQKEETISAPVLLFDKEDKIPDAVSVEKSESDFKIKAFKYIDNSIKSSGNIINWAYKTLFVEKFSGGRAPHFREGAVSKKYWPNIKINWENIKQRSRI